MALQSGDLFLVQRGDTAYKETFDNLKTEIGAGAEITENPPTNPSEGQLWWADSDVDEGGGRLYIYQNGQWVDTSLPGGGFSGDYNDLTNKPNIPPEFNLDEGSVENDIIHWAELGSVQEISSTELGITSSGSSYSNIAATGGSGTGLVCNVIRRKNTGLHEVYVAVRGEGYNVGEIVFLDLNYDPANPNGNGSTGINCTIDQINDVVDGWVARPGEDYFVSSTNDSVNTGMPQFMSGLVTGGDANSLANTESQATLNLFPIGDKGNARLQSYGNNYQVIHQSDTSIFSNSPHISHEVRDPSGQGLTYFRQSYDTFQFCDFNGDGGARTEILELKRDSDNEGRFKLYAKDGSSEKRIELIASELRSYSSGNNIAFNLRSSNGKYNFKTKNGNVGYSINAENNSAGFVLPEDAALASNYDAEGEYIGPIQDRVADLIARVSAIESNEVADDAVDSALLTLVASLSQRLDERDQQIAALTSRLETIEAQLGGTN